MAAWRRLLAVGIGTLGLLGASVVTVFAQGEEQLIEFDSMTPVAGAAVGTVNDRGITGGGIAWTITAGSGEVDRSGHVQVEVRGLVLAPTGVNPISQFKAIVSCVTPHGIVNVSTGLFPASVPTGNSTIDDTVALPHPCKDPIVFVTSPTSRWFAMSNPEDED